jgi:ribulose-5-phosphate 4-epimerase/fuculose-1-phosphate aldolase
MRTVKRPHGYSLRRGATCDALRAAMTRSFDRGIDILALPMSAQLALLARALWADGYRDHTAGHITVKDVDGTLLTNPFPLSWDEVRASDVVRIDHNGHKLDGDYEPTPAIALHVEVHRARPDVAVAVHNHPDWATVWAAMHRVPQVFDQDSAFLTGELAMYAEYVGDVMPSDVARRNVAALGSANGALLANHGVLVVAEDVGIAHLRCTALERRARLAWQVGVLGSDAGVPMTPMAAEALGQLAEKYHRPNPHYFLAAARREIRKDPAVLD